MSTDALLTLCILAVTVVLFVSDRLRLDVVALMSLLALSLFGVAPLDVVLSGFSNAAVLMIAGLFVIGAAISETGAADWLGQRLERASGGSEARAVVVITCATALVSAFMSSTGTVALLMPVVGTLAARRGIPTGRLMMPLAFGAHLGSNLTLISTPPNLLVSTALTDAGRAPFRFFSFTVPGLVVLILGVAYLAFIGRKLLPVGERGESQRSLLSALDLAKEYGLGEALVTLRIPEGSPLVGMSLATANLRAARGVTVVGISRAGEALRVVPRVVFAADDELRVLGTPEAIDAMVRELSVVVDASSEVFTLPADESLAVVVLPRRSRLVGRTLRTAKFRDRYRANVLAVRRIDGKTSVNHKDAALRDLVLRSGDTLLLKSRRKYLRRLHHERTDLVLMAEPDAGSDVVVDRPRALGAIAITFAMLVVMAFGWLPNVIAVLLAALLVVLTGCVRPAEMYRTLNWESVVLIACMMPLATTLERTGVTSFVVRSIEHQLQGSSPVVVLALIVAVTSAFGMVLSNTATAVLLAPVAIRLAAAFHIAPEPLLMGVAFASSAAFATPIASPVNVLVMNPGGYRFGDYARVGVPLQLLVLAGAVLVIPLVFPF